MRQEPAAQAQQGDESHGNCQAFSETLAPFVGLGDEERGKEEPEVDQNAVRLDHAELDRPRPKGRNCRQKRQTDDQSACPVQRPLQLRGGACAKHEQGNDDQPHGQPGYVTAAHVEAASGEGQRQRSGRPAQSTPPFGLTLRAMFVGTRHRQAPSPGSPSLRVDVSDRSAGIGLLSRACSSRRLERRAVHRCPP